MKKGLEFNNKKQCGLWLMSVGMVLILATIFGGKFIINPFVFLAGYYICFFAINVNRKVRVKLSQGSISGFQLRMIYISLVCLFILLFVIAGPFIPGWHFREIWLGVLLATALHFVMWFFIHGWSMIVLGAIGIVISVMGYMFPNIPLQIIYVIDAAVKMALGVYLFFVAKPSKISFFREVAA